MCGVQLGQRQHGDGAALKWCSTAHVQNWPLFSGVFVESCGTMILVFTMAGCLDTQF